MQRHRGMKNMASLEPLQGVCFGCRARKMWVEEAGDRGGARLGGAWLLVMEFGLHPVAPAYLSSFV